MASKYIPFSSYSSSTNQFYITVPSSTLMPIYDSYWAIVQDTNSNYYLMPFNGSGFTCSNINTRSMNLFESSGFYDDSIDFSSGDSFYYELTRLGQYDNRYSTDFRKPVVSTASSMQALCNSVITYSGNNTNSSRFIINKFEIEENSNTGGSCDISPLVPAILMIPAAMLVIAFYTIIYRMFINRRIRS